MGDKKYPGKIEGPSALVAINQADRFVLLYSGTAAVGVASFFTRLGGSGVGRVFRSGTRLLSFVLFFQFSGLTQVLFFRKTKPWCFHKSLVVYSDIVLLGRGGKT